MDEHEYNEPGYHEFIRLFDTYKVPVHSYIQTITKNFHTAEELTQELFIRLWNKRHNFDNIEAKDQYIFRMAHNACMNWFQKVALDARLAKQLKEQLQLAHNNVDDQVAIREAKELLEKAIATLSPQRRKVFELSRKQGLRLNEIAETLDISFHTANHHLVAALAQIREYFLTHSKEGALLLILFALIN